MKIIYDEKRAVECYEESGKAFNRIMGSRNRCLLMNLATVLIILFYVVFCFVTGKQLSLFSGILFIVALVLVLLSAPRCNKGLKRFFKSLAPNIWYYLATNKYELLEVKSEKEDGKCNVSLCIDFGSNVTENVFLGNYEIQESADVDEDTLDLDKGIVFVPALKNANGGEI